MRGKRFRYMFSSLGWSVADVAKFLRVTERTVHNWVSGAVPVPYATYKLLRLQLRYELPGKDWEGWILSAGRLYTPEGHELNPSDFSWWSLLVRRAALFDVLYKEVNDLRRALAQTNQTAQRQAGAGASRSGVSGLFSLQLVSGSSEVPVTLHFSAENRTPNKNFGLIERPHSGCEVTSNTSQTGQFWPRGGSHGR